MFYTLKRRLTGGGALLDQRSHWDTNFFSGQMFPPDFATPIELAIDVDSEGRQMPTLFTTPALIARRDFFDLLLSTGVDNVDAYPAVIHNDESGQSIDDYVALNILGNISCADLGANPGFELGPGIRVIDEPALKRDTARGALIFRLAEDPIQIIVAEKVAQKIRAAGLEDVFLGEVQLTPS